MIRVERQVGDRIFVGVLDSGIVVVSVRTNGIESRICELRWSDQHRCFENQPELNVLLKFMGLRDAYEFERELAAAVTP